MARFDIFENDGSDGYLLDVQSDLLIGLNTRVVVPLLPRSKAPTPAQRLNPVFLVSDTEVIMVTQFIAAIPSRELRKRIGNLGNEQQPITEALDMLFLGF